jgi:hypothetical protein
MVVIEVDWLNYPTAIDWVKLLSLYFIKKMLKVQFASDYSALRICSKARIKVAGS